MRSVLMLALVAAATSGVTQLRDGELGLSGSVVTPLGEPVSRGSVFLHYPRRTSRRGSRLPRVSRSSRPT